MPKALRSQDARDRRGDDGVRTQGEPRLVEPGGKGNPSSVSWYIVWSEKQLAPNGIEFTRTHRISTLARDEGAAQRFFVAWQNARLAPKDAATVNDVLNAYVAWKRSDHARKNRSPRLIKNIESALREVRLHFGPLTPAEVNFAYVQDYIDRRRMTAKETGPKGYVSDRTISIELAYLRSALKRAVKTDAIEGPIPFIELPEGTARHRDRPVTRDERSRLEAAIKDERTPLHLRAFVLIALKTGQRGLHIRNLRWEHVDYQRRILWFRKSNPHAAQNKSCEDMPVSAAVLAALAEIQAKALTPFVIEYIPRKPDGSPARKPPAPDEAKPVGSLKRAWSGLLRRAGVEGLNVHDMRRAFTSHAIDDGADLIEVADIVGLDPKTMRRHYALPSPERHRALIERIDGDED